MGSFDIIKPLTTVLSSAIKNSKQHQGKNSREHRESNLGLLGEKQVFYLRAYKPLSISFGLKILFLGINQLDIRSV